MIMSMWVVTEMKKSSYRLGFGDDVGSSLKFEHQLIVG